jgi:hypothetical protein
MELLSKKILNELRDVDKDSCLSLYMPTHRNHPDNMQDPIKFKNLLKQLEESLGHQTFHGDAKVLLAPFEALLDDKDFWNHTLNGLAIFGTEDFFKVVGVPITLNELVVVANSFHIKPLKKYLQSSDRYQVLGLSLHDFQLYEGNRHSMSQVDLPEDFPDTIKEALGEELTEEHLTVAAYGGVGGNKGNMVHGHGGRKDELDVDAERFFRAAADVVYEQISKPSGLPLVLAALPEHHNLFQKINKNPFLIKEGVTVNPKSVDLDKFVKKAWEVMEPNYKQSLQTLAETFGEASSKDKGSDNLSRVAKAAAESRVDVLLLEADRIIPGRLNEETGTVEKGNLEHPELDDLLDDIGELVSARGGRVVVVPKELMPTETGLAATFRF